MTEGILPPDRQSRTLAEYAAAVASGDPTPGGGSVAATVAALAAALAAMVCNLTLARSVDADAQSALIEARATSAHLRGRLFELAIEDELAYGAYRSAADLPKSTSDERDSRRLALEAALEQAAGAPLRVASACVELLTSLETVAAYGTKHALADAGTSLRLGEAALASALEMVKANTELMRDRERAARLDREAQTLLTGGEHSTSAVTRILDARRGNPIGS
jgi:formiminotetrahydrofolate cyclodeaminase